MVNNFLEQILIVTVLGINDYDNYDNPSIY